MKMKKFAEKSDLLELGLSRPWEGALVGFLSFTFLVVLFWMGNRTLLSLLLWPGVSTLQLILRPKSLDSLPKLASKILFWGSMFGVSAIPPTILGAVLRPIIRSNLKFGMALLLAYICILVICFALVMFLFPFSMD